MMLVLAAAIDEGLASAFVGHPEQKRIFDELLGLPDDVVPIGLALIGRRGTIRRHGLTPEGTAARPTDDLVHWQRW